MKCAPMILSGLIPAVVCLAFTAGADVPQLINYQGRLTDSTGTPLDTTVSMVFAIYDDTAGTGLKWGPETYPAVTVADGLFSVILGSVVAFSDTVFNATARYLGITVGTEQELSPRIRLITVPYAYRVGTVDGASGGIVSGNLSIQSNLSVDGDISASGKATIGTGHNNAAAHAFVAGQNNIAFGLNATVTGSDNTANGNNDVVGGAANLADDHNNTIAGGSGHYTTGLSATIGGGWDNEAVNTDAVVCGGARNSASGYQSVVSGGESNTASGANSVVGGGWTNTAGGDYSSIPGGRANTIDSTADYSYLFGISSNLTQDSTFMVDMPHVRIGNETSGYELPSGDGTFGQVMATDGNGQVSWTTVTPPVGFFPAPAWDSEWFHLSRGNVTTLYHNLGYDPLRYVVDLQFQGANGIHNHGIGAAESQVGNQMGVYYHSLDTNSIAVTRMGFDYWADSIRVRIWVTQ